MRAPTTSEKQLIKIADVARGLNVGRSMVYELVRHGDLTPVHIGRAVRLDASAVDKLIEDLAAAAQATVSFPSCSNAAGNDERSAGTASTGEPRWPLSPRPAWQELHHQRLPPSRGAACPTECIFETSLPPAKEGTQIGVTPPSFAPPTI